MAEASDSVTTDVVIIGGALAGMSLACALAKAGIAVAVIEARNLDVITDYTADGRTAAISHGSAEILKKHSLWQGVEDTVGSILDIRVSDGDSPFFLHYDHTLVGDKPMGYIVENHLLQLDLFKQAKELDTLTLFAPAHYHSVSRDSNQVTVELDNGTSIRAKLIIGADGKFSKIRDFAGIDTYKMPYNQVGIVCNIKHEHPHNGVAQERFLPTGPFASLPMHDPHLSSLVWTEKSSLAPLYLKMSEEEFLLEIQKRLGGFLGNISLASKRFSYPFNLIHAKSYTSHRLALIGDAGHAIHPVAGQGFNLGIRDIGILSELIITAYRNGQDIGHADILQRYESVRMRDNTLMIAITDALVRLFSNNVTPLKSARSLGLGVVNQFPTVKKFFMNHAMGLVTPPAS